MNMFSKKASDEDIGRLFSIMSDILKTFKMGGNIFSEDNFYDTLDSVISIDRDKSFSSDCVSELALLANKLKVNNIENNSIIASSYKTEIYTSMFKLYSIAYKRHVNVNGTSFNALTYSVEKAIIKNDKLAKAELSTLCTALLNDRGSIPLDITEIVKNIYQARKLTLINSHKDSKLNDDIKSIVGTIKYLLSSNASDTFEFDENSMEVYNRNGMRPHKVSFSYLQYGIVYDAKPIGFLTCESMGKVQKIFNPIQYSSVISGFEGA